MVIANAAAVGGKIGENLRAALPRLPLNRQLVTIKTDVPLDGDAQSLGLRARDADALRELYARYGFNQALKELDGGAAPVAVAEREPGTARAGGFAMAAANVPEQLDPALSAPGEYECVREQAQLVVECGLPLRRRH